MRIFEFVLVLCISIIPFYSSTKHYMHNKQVIQYALIGIVLSHFILEGYRWQMIPSYLLTAIIAYCMFKNYTLFKGKPLRKITSLLPYYFGIAMAWVLPTILPIFELPLPSGPYRVGTQYIHIQSNKDEQITAEIGDTRELMVKVWYPSKPANKLPEPYLNLGDRSGFVKKYGIPPTALNYLNHIQTHSFRDAKIEEGTFPIVIFSPGIYSSATGYYAIIEDLVSHGYIVFNINHTYESTGSLFPNGTIRYYDKSYDQQHNNQKMADMAWTATQEYQKAQSEDDQLTAIEHLLRNYVAVGITKRWSADISLVIDELEHLNRSSFLAHHMDTSKIGVFGHSQGGAAAGQALLDESRIKAAINIDGVQWGTMMDTLFHKPFALLSSDWNEDHLDLNKFAYRNGSTTDFYKAKILNSGHASFMDVPLMIRVPQLNEAGQINPPHAHRLSAIMIRQFFDKYLLNEPVNMLELDKKFTAFEIKY